MAFPFFLMFGRKLLRDAIMKRVAFWFEKENIQKPKNLPKLELMAVEYGNSYRKQFIQDYTVRSCFVIGRWSSDDVNIFFPYPWTCFGHESHLMAFHLGLLQPLLTGESIFKWTFHNIMNILTEMRVEANKMEAKTLKKIFSVVFIDFTSWKSD